jgi:CxxC motif-containing protein (DUF1111 family)
MNQTVSSISFIFLFSLIIGCQNLLPPEREEEEILGDAIPELTSEQLRVHMEGDAKFEQIFGVEDGLGPIFVSISCESCHAGDGKGHPFVTLTRFGRYNGNEWDPMTDHGGPQLQERAIAGYPGEIIPSEATGVTRLMAPSVSGLGYIEAVPDSTILALSDPNDSDGDGISGVPNYTIPPPYFVPSPSHIPNNGRYIGRFGKKAGAIVLLQQVAMAYHEDMGITTEFLPNDIFNVQSGNNTGDQVPDPEISTRTLNNVVFYVRTLKIPPRRNEEDGDVLAGEIIFDQIGCGKCHVSTMMTGQSDIEALSHKEIHPYTDMLLHDMGNGLDDGYTEGTALTSEWRTAPLWGIGLSENSQGGSAFFLHDGRASTLVEAIFYHGGEALDSREAFYNMDPAKQHQLVAFLESL